MTAGVAPTTLSQSRPQKSGGGVGRPARGARPAPATPTSSRCCSAWTSTSTPEEAGRWCSAPTARARRRPAGGVGDARAAADRLRRPVAGRRGPCQVFEPASRTSPGTGHDQRPDRGRTCASVLDTPGLEVAADIDLWCDAFPGRGQRSAHAGSMSGGERQMLAIAGRSCAPSAPASSTSRPWAWPLVTATGAARHHHDRTRDRRAARRAGHSLTLTTSPVGPACWRPADRRQRPGCAVAARRDRPEGHLGI